MASSLGWLDSSSADAERARQLLGTFDESDTVDPLGIGSVRDAFSELLFPGISTVQTRGRYFMFVPWVFEQLEREHVASTKAAARNRQIHIELLHQLIEHDGDLGIIGAVARDRVKLLPSTIYWNGLQRLGIFTRPWSMSTYVANLDGLHRHRRLRDSDDEDALQLWHSDLPPAPDDFPNGATLAFRPEESAFLSERIQRSIPESLLAHLLASGRVIGSGEEFPWAIEERGGMPPVLDRRLSLAETFSSAAHGLQLRYNLDVAMMVENQELIDDYRSRVDDWIGGTGVAAADRVSRLDRDELWAAVNLGGTRIGWPTRRFVNTWLDALRDHGPRIVDDESAKELVRNRELETKRRRARLWYRDARERWGGASAATQLRFRWEPARTIINDILEGGTDDAGA